MKKLLSIKNIALFGVLALLVRNYMPTTWVMITSMFQNILPEFLTKSAPVSDENTPLDEPISEVENSNSLENYA